MMKLTKVQEVALDLIQADARYLYALTDITKNAQNIDSNYVCMSSPYIGLFADGTEQWCRKVGLNSPSFTKEEKNYYQQIRYSHKIFSKPFFSLRQELYNRFIESDKYFYDIRSDLEKIIGYSNVGADVFGKNFCGNTILCATYNPAISISNINGEWLIKISEIAGKLAAYVGCTNLPIYEYDKNTIITFTDFHFFNRCPIKIKTFDYFIYFSILCSVNFAIEFIEKVFLDEIVPKFKFAYLQYYYLCDLINEINDINGTKFKIENTLQHRQFRNCLAHYGLGQFLDEKDIIDNDLLKGLTIKAFRKDYFDTKEQIFKELYNLVQQIGNLIF